MGKRVRDVVLILAFAGIALYTVIVQANFSQQSREFVQEARQDVCVAAVAQGGLVHTFAHFFADEEDIANNPEIRARHEQLHDELQQAIPAFCGNGTKISKSGG